MLYQDWEVYTTLYVPKDEEIVELTMGDLEEATEYQIRVVLIADDYNMYDEYDIPSALAVTKCESRYSNIIGLICFL